MRIKTHIIGILAIVLIVVYLLWKLIHFIEIDFSEQAEHVLSFVDVELTEEEADRLDRDFIPGIQHVTSLTGLWAIRFLLASFLMSPVSLISGRSFSLYFRQSIGIVTGFFTSLHVAIFIFAEGFFQVFARTELIAGFIAFLIILSLTMTSSKRAMKHLKRRWKRLHRLVYIAVCLVVLHLVILDQSWMLYGVLFGLGFILRYEPIKKRIRALR